MRHFARQVLARYGGPLVLTCTLLAVVLVCG